jgi:predicted nucleic acid-binding protein
VILVDTSIWVDHLRSRDNRLGGLLDAASVVMHPFVLGELACGNVRRHDEVLGLLNMLPSCPVATEPEALEFIGRRALMGRGLGYIDVHLLASVALVPGMRLWTRDRRLAEEASRLRLAVD